MAQLEIGDRVYYVSGQYGTTRSNPLKGSPFECAGTVDRTKGSGGVGVMWDNGTHNGYRTDALELVSTPPEPNRSFMQRTLKTGKYQCFGCKYRTNIEPIGAQKCPKCGRSAWSIKK